MYTTDSFGHAYKLYPSICYETPRRVSNRLNKIRFKVTSFGHIYKKKLIIFTKIYMKISVLIIEWLLLCGVTVSKKNLSSTCCINDQLEMLHSFFCLLMYYYGLVVIYHRQSYGQKGTSHRQSYITDSFNNQLFELLKILFQNSKSIFEKFDLRH